MTSHPLKQVIEAADRAIVAEDFDALMDFYADDAILVVNPGLYATGKEQIRQAFVRIAEYFNHGILVKQGDMVVLEGGDTALVISETVLSRRKAAASGQVAMWVGCFLAIAGAIKLLWW